MNGYELRLEIWRSAYAFLRNRYEHLREQYKAGLIPERPEFPSYEEVGAYALQMNRFVSDKGGSE